MTAPATATAVCWHCADTGRCPWAGCATCPSPDVPAGTCTACGKPPTPWAATSGYAHTITCDTAACESVLRGHGSWKHAWDQARAAGWVLDGTGCRRCPPCQSRRLPHPGVYTIQARAEQPAVLPAPPAEPVAQDDGDPFASWPYDPPVPVSRLWRLVTRIVPRWAADRAEAA